MNAEKIRLPTYYVYDTSLVHSVAYFIDYRYLCINVKINQKISNHLSLA